MSRGSSVSTVTRLRPGRPGFYSRHRQWWDFLLVANVSRSALRPTPALYSEGVRFESRLGFGYLDRFHSFTQSLFANSGIVPSYRYNRPLPKSFLRNLYNGPLSKNSASHHYSTNQLINQSIEWWMNEWINQSTN